MLVKFLLQRYSSTFNFVSLRGMYQFYRARNSALWLEKFFCSLSDIYMLIGERAARAQCLVLSIEILRIYIYIFRKPMHVSQFY
jgi:hypothetical protein